MLKVYNTLTRKKEEIKTVEKGIVKMYSCGPTVYSAAHIGNMRSYIFMDTLRKVLKYNGYKLNHVMNITDVGHLVSDGDEGEDKMEVAAKKANISPLEIAKKYTDIFLKDIEKLNIERPEHITPATEHIKEMEEYVQKIMDNGYAYETSKGIYFDTSKLSTYGELSRADLEKQLAGARVEVDTEKKNPLDFALWIKAPENHIMKWKSRWGMCYPGWHIECSAMGYRYLGKNFDIHTGGVDAIPIHHENEIAQCRGAFGCIPANYFMHNEFLLIDGGKMSKSLGNCYTVSELEEKGYDPLAYRYLNYTANYRNKLNFTWDALKSADISLNRLREAYKEHIESSMTVNEDELKLLEEKFKYAVNDDLNMPQALAVVWEVAKKTPRSKYYARLLETFDKILSLNISKVPKIAEETVEVNKEVENLLEQRRVARENKDYSESDRLRNMLRDMGYIVTDLKEGQKIEKV